MAAADSRQRVYRYRNLPSLSLQLTALRRHYFTAVLATGHDHLWTLTGSSTHNIMNITLCYQDHDTTNVGILDLPDMDHISLEDLEACTYTRCDHPRSKYTNPKIKPVFSGNDSSVSGPGYAQPSEQCSEDLRMC
jgi:hypothetical protein